MNDTSGNVLAVYQSDLKHEWNLYPLLDFLEFVILLAALVLLI